MYGWKKLTKIQTNLIKFKEKNKFKKFKGKD
jgi:hypothetical protein